MQLAPPLTAQSTVRHTASSANEPDPVKLEPAIVTPDFKRQKVPLEKGYSQMDWMRLKAKGKDLQGRPLNGARNALCLAHADNVKKLQIICVFIEAHLQAPVLHRQLFGLRVRVTAIMLGDHDIQQAAVQGSGRLAVGQSYRLRKCGSTAL
jgi:hypothetical protein